MSKLLEDKRKTRGLRMAELIGEAAEQDESFWGNEVWKEDESDDSFESEEVKPDVFDSDFNDSEDDDEEDSLNELKKLDGKKKEVTNKYREPNKVKSVKRSLESKSTSLNSNKENPKYISSSKSVINEMPTERQIRDSTKAKSMDVDIRLSTESQLSIEKKPPRIQIRPQYTQKELLLEALETEKLNKTWLESQKFNMNLAEEENAKIKMQQNQSGMIRKLSRRGTYNTITFSDDSLIPKCLMDNKIPVVPDNICVVTGLSAKYRDPVTRYPYANLDAYKELKRRFHY